MPAFITVLENWISSQRHSELVWQSESLCSTSQKEGSRFDDIVNNHKELLNEVGVKEGGEGWVKVIKGL